ncbi:sigma-70 family RNA polymerase sigma factor [Micromonospora krabiensis]|uniref:sigma-70 family RNA polymerase sigma factor n=1 Tax=Micromonospora krabiensis TaxID=307121 RepID=UPI000B89746A|nr:sigma-70 family RNA polymerase sigma factor [Micromonospora krabiensis]
MRWVGKSVVRLRRGGGVERERKEFAAFYSGCRDDCLRAVVAVSREPALAEDLVAEAFSRAWASWPKVQRHPAPAAWVVRTALNLRVSWWRRRRRESPLANSDVIGSYEATGSHEDLLTLVRGLPRRQREVVLLRVWLDLDARTTAEVLGISVGTVGAHLSRATAALRTHLMNSDLEEVS